MKKIILFLGIALNILSCSDRTETIAQNSMTTSESISHNKMSSNERLLNDEQVKSIGNLHNQFLTQVFSNYDFQTKNRVLEIRTQFEKIDLKGNVIDWNKKDYGNIENELNYLKNNLSDTAFSIIEKGMMEAEKMENVESFSNTLELLNEEAKEKLTGIELDTVLIALNVFENSAQLWLPVDEGGNGIGYEFFNKYNMVYNIELSNKRTPRQMIRTALAADGLSAAAGFLVGAFVIGATAGTGGLATPAIIGFLVGVAGESAIASGAAIGIDIG